MAGFLFSVIFMSTTYLIVSNGFLLDTKFQHHIPRDGVYFGYGRMVRLTFDDQEFPAKSFSYFRVGFITKKKQGILLQIRDESNTEYISLDINNSGGVKFFVDMGFERWELNTAVNMIDYTDGLEHDVIVQRSGDGRTVTMQITTDGADANRSKADALATATGMLSNRIGNLIIDKPTYLFIGNNDTSNYYNVFEGCITKLQIDNVYPLQKAFQKPTPSYVQITGSNRLQLNTCGCVIKVCDPYSHPAQTKSHRNPETIPLRLRSDMAVKYVLNRTLEYSINSYNTLVKIGFVTDFSQGTLVKIGDSENSYLLLEIIDNGTVQVLFNDGSYNYVMKWTTVNVADGRPHTLRLSRANGQTELRLSIDYNYGDYDMLDCRIQAWLESPKSFLYIGNDALVNADVGFDGCIYYLVVGDFSYPHDADSYINVLGKGSFYDGDLITSFNETLRTDYMRYICGMDRLFNSTDLPGFSFE